jgi:plasmid stabilization system protein ParE
MENKKYTVIVSDKASDMLVSHIRFLTQASEKAAKNLIKEFKKATKSLENLPERNPWFSDPAIPSNKYRKLLINKQYLIIYQIKDNNVFLDFIIDCRQDYTWLL